MVNPNNPNDPKNNPDRYHSGHKSPNDPANPNQANQASRNPNDPNNPNNPNNPRDPNYPAGQPDKAWAANRLYHVGDRVQESPSGGNYECAKEHTSGAGTMAQDRSANPSNWKSV